MERTGAIMQVTNQGYFEHLSKKGMKERLQAYFNRKYNYLEVRINCEEITYYLRQLCCSILKHYIRNRMDEMLSDYSSRKYN